MGKRRNLAEKYLLPWTLRLCRNSYLTAVRDTFCIMMPFIFVLTLLGMAGGVLLSPTGPVMNEDGLGLGMYLSGNLHGQAYRESDLFRILESVQRFFAVCNALLSLLFSVVLAARLSKLWRCNVTLSVLCTLAGYAFFLPGAVGSYDEFLKFFVGRGFFIALCIATLTVRIFSILSHMQCLRVPVPAAVPPRMAVHMRYTLPLAATLTMLLLLSILWAMTAHSYGTLETVLRDHVSMETSQSLGMALVYTFLVRILWWTGLNGVGLMAFWSEAFYVPAQIANELDGARHIFTIAFFDSMMVSLLGLAIAIWVFSSRRDWRSICAFSVLSLLFSISEPFLFALPVVLNPAMLIPYIVAPMVNVIVGWAAIAWGIVPAFQYAVPWATPVLLDGYLSTGDVMGFVLQLVWLSVDIVIYSPFVIIFNLMRQDEKPKDGEA